MFKKCCLLLVIFCANQLSAEVCPLEDNKAQVGRYQISAAPSHDEIVYVYLLDTQTGAVWSAHHKNIYNRNLSDWKKQASLPLEEVD